MTDSMGAITIGQLGKYTRGWAGRKLKKKRGKDPSVIINEHLEKATEEMHLEAIRNEAVENFNSFG